MTRAHKIFWKLVLFLCFARPPAHAQDVQFKPEIDAYLTLHSNFRAYLQAKDERDGGDSTQFSIGPSIQLYLKPLIKLKKVKAFDLDDSKSRLLVLETGYRRITTPGDPSENRMQTAVTSNFPLKAGFHLSDRNRADLDWKSGRFTWRYRSKLTIDRTVSIHSYHLIPYVAVEPFYESQYKKWSATDIYAGCLFPVGKHVQFNAYYEHENDTSKRPNKQQTFVGLVLYLYLSVAKK